VQEAAHAPVAVDILQGAGQADLEQGGALAPAVQVNAVLGQGHCKLRIVARQLCVPLQIV
jgi:hypothetical protein